MLNEIKYKAATLIEALPYIQKLRGQTVVIKYGGAAMEDPLLVESTLRDIVFLEAVGINPVIVHGGGKAISAEMQKAGLKPEFIEGMRVTDKASIDIVDSVLSNVINPAIVDKIMRLGGKAKGLSGKDIFEADKMWLEKTDGQKVDIGFVGEVHRVKAATLMDLIHQEIVPCISPVAKSKQGEVYNINADVAAAQTAIAVEAKKLIFISDVNGIMLDPKDANSVIPTLNIKEIQDLKKSGVISGGMLPKVNSCIKALESGVEKIHLIDGRIPHSMLLEIFTDSGIGTQILKS
ncbi:MAG: acetylglutamate kinase [Verrucomicrobiota bacterium]|nr:acetylglutamate kinase [Verrucomicrobiota bacterium]